MISPFAPLYPWLHDALGTQLMKYVDGCRSASSYLTPHGIDLRNAPFRLAVLRCLHDVGHSRPWALGQPWSPLTDEQAGRATAEILRAVGEDPSKPVGVVPICVLTVLRPIRCSINGCKESVSVKDCYSTRGAPGFEYHSKFNQIRLFNIGTETFMPAQTEDDAISIMRSLGCLFIEELTP